MLLIHELMRVVRQDRRIRSPFWTWLRTEIPNNADENDEVSRAVADRCDKFIISNAGRASEIARIRDSRTRLNAMVRFLEPVIAGLFYQQQEWNRVGYQGDDWWEHGNEEEGDSDEDDSDEDDPGYNSAYSEEESDPEAETEAESRERRAEESYNAWQLSRARGEPGAEVAFYGRPDDQRRAEESYNAWQLSRTREAAEEAAFFGRPGSPIESETRDPIAFEGNWPDAEPSFTVWKFWDWEDKKYKFEGETESPLDKAIKEYRWKEGEAVNDAATVARMWATYIAVLGRGYFESHFNIPMRTGDEWFACTAEDPAWKLVCEVSEKHYIAEDSTFNLLPCMILFDYLRNLPEYTEFEFGKASWGKQSITALQVIRHIEESYWMSCATTWTWYQTLEALRILRDARSAESRDHGPHCTRWCNPGCYCSEWLRNFENRRERALYKLVNTKSGAHEEWSYGRGIDGDAHATWELQHFPAHWKQQSFDCSEVERAIRALFPPDDASVVSGRVEEFSEAAELPQAPFPFHSPPYLQFNIPEIDNLLSRADQVYEDFHDENHGDHKESIVRKVAHRVVRNARIAEGRKCGHARNTEGRQFGSTDEDYDTDYDYDTESDSEDSEDDEASHRGTQIELPAAKHQHPEPEDNTSNPKRAAAIAWFEEAQSKVIAEEEVLAEEQPSYPELHELYLRFFTALMAVASRVIQETDPANVGFTEAELEELGTEMGRLWRAHRNFDTEEDVEEREMEERIRYRSHGPAWATVDGNGAPSMPPAEWEEDKEEGEDQWEDTEEEDEDEEMPSAQS